MIKETMFALRKSKSLVVRLYLVVSTFVFGSLGSLIELPMIIEAIFGCIYNHWLY